MMEPREIVELMEENNKLREEVEQLRKERGNFSAVKKQLRILRDELTKYKELSVIGQIAVESGTPEDFASVGCHKLADAIGHYKQ